MSTKQAQRAIKSDANKYFVAPIREVAAFVANKATPPLATKSFPFKMNYSYRGF